MTALIYKGTPIVWHVVEMPDQSPFYVNQGSEDGYFDEVSYQQAHKLAITNAIPVKEEFQEKVYQAIWKDHDVEVEDHVWRWQPTPNKLYEDTGLVFEYREEIEHCMCTESCGYGLGSYDNCKTLKRTKKVAVLVSDKPKEQTFTESIKNFSTINTIAKEMFDNKPPVEVKEKQTDSEKLRILAEWFNIHDNKLNFSGIEVQDDLRRIAKQLESSEGQDELWKDAFINTPVKIHEKTEQYLQSKFHITKI